MRCAVIAAAASVAFSAKEEEWRLTAHAVAVTVVVTLLRPAHHVQCRRKTGDTKATLASHISVEKHFLVIPVGRLPPVLLVQAQFGWPEIVVRFAPVGLQILQCSIVQFARGCCQDSFMVCPFGSGYIVAESVRPLHSTEVNNFNNFLTILS
eukprot:742235-Amphidinium_carterae.1